MLFNSLSFLIFFLVVSILYFALPHRFRWVLLLGASCFFYMCFIPIYIVILAATIAVDYVAGILIEGTPEASRKKAYLTVSIASVCAILFVFKYFNFFNNNLAALARVLHWNYPMKTLRLILPIGLSFHTFQSLSYVFEVYRGRQPAEKHFGLYSLYVMYFPQLVAGPIERPQNLLHQLKEVKRLDWQRLWNGVSLSLWGLFKKVVVADSLAIYTDTIYNNSRQHTGASLLLATYFFAIQIYCDFSGYSDIARGISRIYGIELMKNFETPYFAKSISEFWSRWHISLSTWFRDYVYIPLGGNRVSLGRSMFNIGVVFLISGLWHGANWTFVIWGALNGIYYLVWRSLEPVTAGVRRRIPAFGRLPLGVTPTATVRPWRALAWLRDGFLILVTFHLILLSWVFFRAANVSTALDTLRRIAVNRGPLFWDPIIVQGVLAIVLLVVLDILHRRTGFWDCLNQFPKWLRLGYSVALFFGIVLFGVDTGTRFIYFQF
ncbi:MAG: membrane-bound O-acyltransferase family protein [Verrucomicrobia bacterium]|nr:MAG: membrane-bound O-acyltransferase family protein [Verrucomicrobiota bacterium]